MPRAKKETIAPRMSFKTMSELGLIVEINTIMLHQLGLAIQWSHTTNSSKGCLISPDGFYEYPRSKSSILLKKKRFRLFSKRVQELQARIKQGEQLNVPMEYEQIIASVFKDLP